MMYWYPYNFHFFTKSTGKLDSKYILESARAVEVNGIDSIQLEQ